MMRTLELKNNGLYLDGEQLKHLTEFRIDFVAGDAMHQHSCELYAKGIVEGAETPKHSLWAYYIIEEQVELVGSFFK